MTFRALGLTLLMLGVAPSETFLAAQTSSRASVPLSMPGAETLESLMLLWEDSYRQSVDPSFRMNFQPTMSGPAIQAFINGKALLTPVTRDMREDEVQAFTAKWGYAPTRIAVGMDALVILVNKNNPLKQIKTEQLDALWTSSRLQGWPKDVRIWGDLGVTAPHLVDRPIRLVGHPEGSGTRDYFRHIIELDGKPKPNIERGADIMAMEDILISDQTAMGYSSVSQVFTSTHSVAIVPVGGDAAVEPTPANIATGYYPFASFTYIYVNKTPGKPLDLAVQKFLTFALSREGQKQVVLDGRIPLPEDMVRMNLHRINR